MTVGVVWGGACVDEMTPPPSQAALEEIGKGAAWAVGDIADSKDYPHTSVLLDHMS